MKNKKGIWLLFTANFVSAMSQGISMISIPWYFASNDQMKTFGLVYVVTNIIALFWVPVSGTMTDKFDRKYLLMILMLILGLCLAAVGFYGVANEGLPWYYVAGIFTLTFLNYTLHYPTLYAFVQEMTEPKYYSRITSMIEIQGQTATVCAGVGAALLLEGTIGTDLSLFGIPLEEIWATAAWPIHEIFLLDAVTYFIAIGVLSMISYTSFFKRNKKEKGIWNQLKVGINYLQEHPYVFIFGVASYCVFVAVIIEGFYLMAPYVQYHLKEGADVYAIGEMTYAAGALLAGLSIRHIFKRMKLTDSIVILAILGSIVFFVLFATKNVMVFYIFGILLGLVNAGVRIQRVTYLFSKLPNEIYGRAVSIFNLINIGLRVFFMSIFALPFFQKDENFVYPFLILGIFILVSAIVIIVYRKKILLPDSKV